MYNTQDTPIELVEWLAHDGSLTAKFEALAGQPLRVQPMFEGYEQLTRAQAKALGLPRPQMAWVREVLLFGSGDEPWAKAISIFPVSSLKGKARRLRYLGSTPLGYVLFGRQKPVCHRLITQTNVAEVYDTPCWTRQNYYDWQDARILVQEAFLPAFEVAIK